MACSHPIPAIDYGMKINKDGKEVRDIRLLDIRHKYFSYGLDDLKSKFGDKLLLLPCGHCYLCSLDYSRMWASRIILESQKYDHNCFITLTYADGCVPDKPNKRHWQLFMKRLRRELDFPVRFFATGEKGDESGRSHMHAIIFGYDFPDKVPFKRSSSGMIIYRSPMLEKLWPYGISSIGSVTPESSQYVAKYSMKKKISGVDTGEWILMSRRPGIGLDGFSDDHYVTDKLYLYGKTFPIPRYFDKLAESKNSDAFLKAKEKRLIRAKSRCSKKYLFNLSREEFALKKEENDRIYNDALKRRIL